MSFCRPPANPASAIPGIGNLVARAAAAAHPVSSSTFAPLSAHVPAAVDQPLKSAFLANLSHEVRTPLNGIFGLVRLVRNGGVTPAQGRHLDLIEASGQELLDLFSNLLVLSRLESGALELRPALFNPGDALGTLLSTGVATAHAKGLSFHHSLPELPRMLLGDAGLLRQALGHYLDNAVKFTAQGGVLFSGSVLEETDDGYLLYFEVSDTGIGMYAEQLARVFQPFEQGDNSSTRRHHGCGCGLAIVRGIAKLMGGDCGARSRPEMGSTFWLTLRMDKPRPTGAPGHQAPTITAPV